MMKKTFLLLFTLFSLSVSANDSREYVEVKKTFSFEKNPHMATMMDKYDFFIKNVLLPQVTLKVNEQYYLPKTSFENEVWYQFLNSRNQEQLLEYVSTLPIKGRINRTSSWGNDDSWGSTNSNSNTSTSSSKKYSQFGYSTFLHIEDSILSTSLFSHLKDIEATITYHIPKKLYKKLVSSDSPLEDWAYSIYSPLEDDYYGDISILKSLELTNKLNGGQLFFDFEDIPKSTFKNTNFTPFSGAFYGSNYNDYKWETTFIKRNGMLLSFIDFVLLFQYEDNHQLSPDFPIPTDGVVDLELLKVVNNFKYSKELVKSNESAKKYLLSHSENRSVELEPVIYKAIYDINEDYGQPIISFLKESLDKSLIRPYSELVDKKVRAIYPDHVIFRDDNMYSLKLIQTIVTKDKNSFYPKRKETDEVDFMIYNNTTDQFIILSFNEIRHNLLAENQDLFTTDIINQFVDILTFKPGVLTHDLTLIKTKNMPSYARVDKAQHYLKNQMDFQLVQDKFHVEYLENALLEDKTRKNLEGISKFKKRKGNWIITDCQNNFLMEIDYDKELIKIDVIN